MSHGVWRIAAAGCVLGALAAGAITARDGENPAPKADSTKQAPSATDKDRDADREAIHQAGEAFAAAFEKGDAKAVAALWTDGAEYVGENGTTLRGRAEIENEFTAAFKDGPPAKVEVDVRSVRFPSRDTAVEEGYLRHHRSGSALPSSTRYQTVLVREDGKWLIAHSREWAPEDRLGDLAFLIGRWAGGPK